MPSKEVLGGTSALLPLGLGFLHPLKQGKIKLCSSNFPHPPDCSVSFCPSLRLHLKFIPYWAVTSSMIEYKDFIFSSIIAILFNLKSTFLPHSPQRFAKYPNQTIALMSFASFQYNSFFRVGRELNDYPVNCFILYMTKLKLRALIGHTAKIKTQSLRHSILDCFLLPTYF